MARGGKQGQKWEIITTSEDGSGGEVGQGKWFRGKAVEEAGEPEGSRPGAAPRAEWGRFECLKELVRIKQLELP